MGLCVPVPFSPLHERHPTPEVSEELAELESDVTGANNDQVLRQGLEVQQRCAGEIPSIGGTAGRAQVASTKPSARIARPSALSVVWSSKPASPLKVKILIDHRDETQ